jgi:hypothetical protein
MPRGATDQVTPGSEVEWRLARLMDIAQGQGGVPLMAGGHCICLGGSTPKGYYDVALPSHRLLFRYHAERMAGLKLVAQEGTDKLVGSVVVSWYVMINGPTRTLGPSPKTRYLLSRVSEVFVFICDRSLHPLCRDLPCQSSTSDQVPGQGRA